MGFLPSIPVTDEARQTCWRLADQRMERFSRAANTKVLAGRHVTGIFRGLIAEWAAAFYLDADWQAERDDAPFDLLTAGGKRLDVKAGPRWDPLRVPIVQMYKVDPDRVDGFVLAFVPRVNTELVELCGWISTDRFLDEAREDYDLPEPAACIDASALEWLP